MSPCLHGCRIENLTKAVESMKLTDEQKTNLTSFLEQKKQISDHGELRDQQFTRLDELGFGNGGVVLKVEHKPTKYIMARKVGVTMCVFGRVLQLSHLIQRLGVGAQGPRKCWVWSLADNSVAAGFLWLLISPESLHCPLSHYIVLLTHPLAPPGTPLAVGACSPRTWEWTG